MIQRFKPITEVEEARKQLRALWQTKGFGGYIQHFQELRYRISGMTLEEAFYAFLAGLQPHLQEHVGTHVRGDLEAAMAMAMRMEIFHGGEQPKVGSHGKKGAKHEKKTNRGVMYR